MSSLPLKVRVDIRDHWSNEDGALQTSVKALAGLLGHEVILEPEWQLLLAELDTCYPDKTNFVAVLAGCAEVWAKSVMELLDDSVHEAWTDKLLSRIKANRLPLFLEASSSDKCSTTWSDQRHGFILSLPKKQIYQPAELFPIFHDNLQACFDEKAPQQSDGSMDGRTAVAASDWADIGVNTTTGEPAIIVEKPSGERESQLPLRSRVDVEFLPNAATLPRPDQLFLKPPYHLTIFASSTDIEIQGSHSPSLQLIADYLKRWCRVNHQDTRRPPVIEVKLHQCAFGLGEMSDRLALSTAGTKYTDCFRATAPLVLALVEGVLGYEQVSAHAGTWSYRRNAGFK